MEQPREREPMKDMCITDGENNETGGRPRRGKPKWWSLS